MNDTSIMEFESRPDMKSMLHMKLRLLPQLIDLIHLQRYPDVREAVSRSCATHQVTATPIRFVDSPCRNLILYQVRVDNTPGVLFSSDLLDGAVDGKNLPLIYIYNNAVALRRHPKDPEHSYEELAAECRLPACSVYPVRGIDLYQQPVVLDLIFDNFDSLVPGTVSDYSRRVNALLLLHMLLLPDRNDFESVYGVILDAFQNLEDTSYYTRGDIGYGCVSDLAQVLMDLWSPNLRTSNYYCGTPVHLPEQTVLQRLEYLRTHPVRTPAIVHSDLYRLSIFSWYQLLVPCGTAQAPPLELLVYPMYWHMCQHMGITPPLPIWSSTSKIVKRNGHHQCELPLLIEMQ